MTGARQSGSGVGEVWRGRVGQGAGEKKKISEGEIVHKMYEVAAWGAKDHANMCACSCQDLTFEHVRQWFNVLRYKSADIFKQMCDGLKITQLSGWGKTPEPFASSFSTLLLLLVLFPPLFSPLGWLCVAPWGFQWAWAALARPVSLDGIEMAGMMHPGDGCS